MKSRIFSLLSIFFLIFSTFAFSKNQFPHHVIKSKNDTREYHTLTLNNGIEVLLASDNSLSQSAVSLTVGVGQFQDPANQQGLAHYLEHMIFMGSEKHPEPNALMKLVKGNNGFLNAMTEAEQTTYYLKIANSQFEKALSMLSSSIQTPLFNQIYAEKEINAIDAEWSAAKESDGFAMLRTNALTSAKSHPMRQLGIGNLTTLKNKKNSNLQAELKAFHQQYYSANIMKLAIVGNQSLSELAKLAEKYFATVENKNVVRPLTNLASFKKNNLKKQIFLQTKVKNDSLILQFPMASNQNQWAKKPNKFVQYMLSSEEDGALIDVLKSKGLIEAMQVDINSNLYGADGAILIYFVLTEEGKSNKNKIISTFFNYVNLIKNKGITQNYAKELQFILKNQFDDFQTPDALNLAVTFSRQMLDIPVVDVLQHSSYFPTFDKKSIEDVMAYMSPKNLRLWHISDHEQTDTNLVYAKGSYRIGDISKDQFNQWQQSEISIVLPKLMKIENDNTEFQLSDTLIKPTKVVDKHGLQAWLMHSQYHKDRQGVLGITLQNSLFQQDVKHHVMTNILLTILSKKLQRMAVKAGQRDQVYIGGSQNKYGDIAFNFAGKTIRHTKYVKKLFNVFNTVEITQKDFDNALKLYIENTLNVDEQPLHNQAGHYFSIVTKVSPFIWHTTDKIATANRISLTELEAFHQRILTNSFVDIFAFGHYDDTTVKNIATEVQTILGINKDNYKLKHLPLYQPKSATLLSKKVDIKQDNVMLKDTYVYPKISRKISTQLQLLNKLFESQLFKELRTNKQLAYEIGSYQEDIHQYPAFSLFIQSSNTDLQALKEYFIGFLFQFEQKLKATDENVITQIKHNMINAIEQKPENIYVESQRYFIDWLEQRDNYDTNEKIVNILKATNKSDLINLYSDMLLEGNSANIMIQLRGENFKETPFFEWDNLVNSTN